MTRAPSAAEAHSPGGHTGALNPASGRPSDRSETFFVEPEACREILRRRDFSARRASAGLRLASAPTQELAQFFGSWLMYSEGPRHRDLRSLATKALRRLQFGLEGAPARTGTAPQAFDLVADYCRPFVWDRSAHLFGVPESQRQLWFTHLTLVCSLPGIARPTKEQLSLATDSLRALRKSIGANSSFGLLCVLQDEARGTWDRSTLVDLSINLVGDGLHPTVAALATELWLRSGVTGSNSRSLRFHEDPPFQYIARTAERDTRVAGSDVGRQERVIACIAGANNAQSVGSDTSRPLTFGLGRHVCIGRAIAERCILDGVSEFEKWIGSDDLVFQQPEWVDSVGYRAIKSCRVSGSPRIDS